MTMNIEFCEENSSTSKIMCYFRKIRKGGRGWAPRHFKVDPPLEETVGQYSLSNIILCLIRHFPDFVSI